MVHLSQVHIPVRHVNRFAYNGVAIRYSIILAACLNHIKSDLDSIRAREKLVTNLVLKAVDTGVTGIGLIILNIGWKGWVDRKSTRLNSSHGYISYAVFCLKKK